MCIVWLCVNSKSHKTLKPWKLESGSPNAGVHHERRVSPEAGVHWERRVSPEAGVHRERRVSPEAGVHREGRVSVWWALDGGIWVCVERRRRVYGYGGARG